MAEALSVAEAFAKVAEHQLAPRRRLRHPRAYRPRESRIRVTRRHDARPTSGACPQAMDTTVSRPVLHSCREKLPKTLSSLASV